MIRVFVFSRYHRHICHLQQRLVDDLCDVLEAIDEVTVLNRTGQGLYAKAKWTRSWPTDSLKIG